MKKYIVLLSVLFAMTSLFGVANPFNDTNLEWVPNLPDRDGTEMEVWVDDDYSDGNAGIHTWGVDAFDNLTDALAACAVVTDQSSYDDLPVINVAGGEYGGVSINKAAKFIGDENDLPLINDPSLLLGGYYPTGFLCNDANDISAYNADYLTIKNFRIDFDDPESSSLNIYIKGTDYVWVENVEVANACQGITLWGCSNSTVKNNLIEWIEIGGQLNGGGIGIYVGCHSGGGAKIANYNLVEGNVINGTAAGEYSFSTPGICGGLDRRNGYNDIEEYHDNIFRDNHIFGTYGASAVCIEIGTLWAYMQNVWPQYYDETEPYNDDGLDNIVENNECTGNIWAYSIYLTKNLIIRNNVIVDCNYAISLGNDNPGINISFNNFMNCEYNVILDRHTDENSPEYIYDYHVNDAEALYNWNNTVTESVIDQKMADGDELYPGMGTGTLYYTPFVYGEVINYAYVNDGTATDFGPANADVNVTLTGADSDNYVDMYQCGSLSHSVVSTDDFGSSGCNVRAPIILGIAETGSVTATLVFDAAGIDEFYNYSTPNRKLLKRVWVDADTSWGEWTDTGASVNGVEFTLTGVDTFGEYTIGANSAAPVIDETQTIVDPDNSQLTFQWGNTGAEQYIVYSSPDPYAVAANWDSVTTISTQNYTGSADNLYYRIIPVVGGRALGNDPSAVVGGVTYTCEANVEGTNINVIALPLTPVDNTPGTPLMASDLGNLIGTDKVNTISKWDIYSQSWISASYMDGLGWGGDFELSIGESYMVGVLEDCNIVIAGVRPDPKSGYLITSESTNANFVMIPLDKYDIDTYTELSNDIDGGTHIVNSIAYWNNLTQSWTSKSWSVQEQMWMGTDFDIEIGMPYMFFPTAYVGWPTVE